VHLKRAGNKCVRCAQHTHRLFHLSGAGECHPSFMEGTGDSVMMLIGANELTQPQHRNTQREPKNTHTHTWEAGVRHVGYILVVLIMRGTVATHTQVPNTLLDADSPRFLACRQYTLHPCFETHHHPRQGRYQPLPPCLSLLSTRIPKLQKTKKIRGMTAEIVINRLHSIIHTGTV
jgi:hypothetical protein